MALRRAAVAGTWYPAAPSRLSAEVTRHLDAAGDAHPAVPPAADVVAGIVPHAGLMYSGPVAAHFYRLLRSRRYTSIVLVGPSHHVAFDGVSIWPRGAFETPLGPLRIDEELATAVTRDCAIVQELPAAHAREHSLEMQLPFLALLAPDTPIVPLVMGLQTRDTALALGDALASAARRPGTLLLASSDLSHFRDGDTAAALDRQVVERVEAGDDEALMDLLARRPDHACGGGPIVSVLRAARQAGVTNSRTLDYADSGDVSGDKSSVVGYMAAALWR